MSDWPPPSPNLLDPLRALASNAARKAADVRDAVLATMRDPDLQRRLELLSHQSLNDFGFDPFGYSPAYVRELLPYMAVLYRNYFRARVHGIDHVPPQGRVMLVANHSGQLPFDGAMIGLSLLLDREPPRMTRAMVEKWVPTIPFASVFMARCGQVVGTPDNCRALLRQEEAILVFPEGAAGISKTFDHRYQLQSFGMGFMRLALETRTPIVPVAVIGAEEQAPSLYNWQAMARLLGTPAVPITPTFPWLGPLGLLPLPVRYHLHFGEPLSFQGDHDDDDLAIGKHVKVVKTALRGLIERGLSQRTGIFV